ncbi:MAG: MTH938/NDUFAF3 family protein [Pseudomonadota bacterium]
MKLHFDQRPDTNYITGYSDTGIQVRDRKFSKPLVVSADAFFEDRLPASFSELDRHHIESLISLEPEIVLLATGSRQQFLAPELSQIFLTNAVGLESMDIGAACRSFNILIGEDRNVVAAFFFDSGPQGS